MLAQAEKSCAIEFRVTANVVIRVRMQFCPVGIPPKLLRVVFALGIYCAGIPIVFLTSHVRAALNQQNFLATRRKAISQSAATRARTDDDEIVIAPVVHADSSQRGANPYAPSRENYTSIQNC